MEELKLYFNGALPNSKNPEQQERAKIIQQLVETDDYTNTSFVTKKQLQKTSQAFKQEQPDAQITHILDAGFDNQYVFTYIDKELEDEFVRLDNYLVIQMKLTLMTKP